MVTCKVTEEEDASGWVVADCFNRRAITAELAAKKILLQS